MRLLADTHVLVRWLFAAHRLSKEQRRLLDVAVKRREPVAISAMTLLEIATLVSDGKLEIDTGLGEFLDRLQEDVVIQLLPISYEVALEVAYLGTLRDPADRAIVATARVHGLRLLSSDQRIVSSNLVSVID